MKDKIVYYLFLGFVKSVSLLPFRAIYLLSDLCYYLVRYVFRYRRIVVRTNLAKSFPNKTDDERLKIEEDFYRYFCDMLLEGVKSYRMSYDEVLSHVEFENVELMKNYFVSGTNVIVDVAHRGNWEWMPAMYWQFNLPDLVGAEFYRPGRNEYVNNLMREMRHRLGTTTINKNDAMRALVKFRRDKKVFGVGLLADQVPSIPNIHFWTNFLGQETPFLSGPERIARMFKAAIIYCDVERVSRGHYKYTIIDITPNAADEPENAPTQRYAELLEASIMREPATWLWSHRRWKHRREDIEKLKQEADKKS